ncbi:MAG: YlxR family protein [Clostridia bacterium]|nr:YlxR family protein [Clostridia bacterium]
MNTKAKKVPLRKCTGCGESFPKRDLIRVVRSPEGEVSLDFTGKKSGRGAYVCKNAQCFKKARKANRFRTNLECDIPEEVLAALEEEITAWEAEDK